MRALLATLALTVLAPNAADACFCAPPPEPCQAAWEVTTIVSGTVERLERKSHNLLVALTVHRTWRDAGASPGARTIELSTGAGQASCGFPFEVGETYLVYASAGRVSSCSRTRRLEDAADDLDYLRDLEAGGRRSRVFGRVHLPDGSGGWRPFSGASIELHGGDDVWTNVADAEGRFEFVNLPPARYRLSARDHPIAKGRVPAVRIAHSSACARVDLYVRPPRP